MFIYLTFLCLRIHVKYGFEQINGNFKKWKVMLPFFYERRITFKVQCSLHTKGAWGTLTLEAPNPNIHKKVKSISSTAIATRLNATLLDHYE